MDGSDGGGNMEGGSMGPQGMEGWGEGDSGESSLRAMGYNVNGGPEPDTDGSGDSKISYLESPIVKEVAVFLAKALALFLAIVAVGIVVW